MISLIIQAAGFLLFIFISLKERYCITRSNFLYRVHEPNVNLLLLFQFRLSTSVWNTPGGLTRLFIWEVGGCISQSFHHSQLDLVQGQEEASIIYRFKAFALPATGLLYKKINLSHFSNRSSIYWEFRIPENLMRKRHIQLQREWGRQSAAVL